MSYGNNGYASGSLGLPDFQFVDDDKVLAARFRALEVAVFFTPPRRPGVGDWVLDMDTSGNLVAVNLRLSMSYPITLGAGTAIKPS
jgi:hypothetical protein